MGTHHWNCDYRRTPGDTLNECYCPPSDGSGSFQPCGCLERERCQDGCECCNNCVGCHCGED